MAQVNEEMRKNIERKYIAEGGINLYSGGATVIRPCDLYQCSKNSEMRDALEGCNIYVVGRRRKISICPYSLRVANGSIRGDFRLHDESPFSFERFSFSQNKPWVNQHGKQASLVAASVNNLWGSSITALYDGYGKIDVPTHVLLAHTEHNLSTATDIEVVYIGQGFGQSGKRLAIDRLSSHSTLQRILSEAADEYPQDEILILMFRYEHSKHILSSAGDFSVEPKASEEEERKHFANQMRGTQIDRKSRITLAEAALINYFKPRYNVTHKDSFSVERNKKLKTLKKLFEVDLTALIVEMSTANYGARLFSASAPARDINDVLPEEAVKRLSSLQSKKEKGLNDPEIKNFITEMTHVHIAQFPLYSQAERETFLHAFFSEDLSASFSR